MRLSLILRPWHYHVLPSAEVVRRQPRQQGHHQVPHRGGRHSRGAAAAGDVASSVSQPLILAYINEPIFENW